MPFPKAKGLKPLRSELTDLQGKYENYVLLTTSRNTAARYSRALTAFLDMFADRKTPDEVTRVDMQDYVLYRLRAGVSARTVNYEVGIIKSFWNWMMHLEIVPYNPCAKMKHLKEVDPERHSLTEEEQIRLYETARATGRLRDYLLVALVLTTGLRAETMIQLTKDEVDFEEKSLKIPGHMMKAKRNHTVPLRDDVLECINQCPHKLFEKYGVNGLSLTYQFNKLMKRSGIARKGLRIGRRTFATTLLRTGADLRIVQDLLGHRNIATTSRYLMTADIPQTREAIDRLPRPGQTPPEEV